MPHAVRLPAAFRKPQVRREEYLRVRADQGELLIHPQQGSGVLSSVVWASGLARLPIGLSVNPGDGVEYFSFEALLA